MNDTLRAIAERYSCRDFTDEPPSDEQLAAIAQAAIQSPSGVNRQYWHVVVVKNRELIADMDAEGMRILSEMDSASHERMMSRGGSLFYNAPTMIVVAIKQAQPPGAELYDCGILAQNVALAATSLGLDNLICGLTIYAFAGDKAAEFKARLGFPDGYECGLAVLLGHAKTPSTPHVPDQAKITIID